MSVSQRTTVCGRCRAPLRIHQSEFVGREFACPECGVALRISDGEVVVAESPTAESQKLTAKRFIGPFVFTAGLLATFFMLAFAPSAVEIEKLEPAPKLVQRQPADEKNAAALDSREGVDKVSDELAIREEGWAIAESRPAPQPTKSLLPPAVVDVPRTKRLKRVNTPADDGEVNEQAFRERQPIEVALVPWDRNAEPLSVIVEGGLTERAEQRLSREIVGFETARPTQLSILVKTLAELAGVPVRVDGRWPVSEVTARFDRVSVGHMIRELLSNQGCESWIDANGYLVVQNP